MPTFQLDAIPALIIVDLQRGIVGMDTAHPAGEVVERSAQLAAAFRDHGLPVVLVCVAGIAPGRTDLPKFDVRALPADWTELVSELDRQPEDHVVIKHRVGAFLGTDLDDYLRSREVTQVVLAGIATSIGVESTARNAHDLGYNVTLVTDAMTDRTLEMHSHSVQKIFPRMGETVSTGEILTLLQARAR